MKAKITHNVNTQSTRPRDFVPSRPVLRNIDGPLYEVLSAGFPDRHKKDGRLDWRSIADDLHISAQAMHKWLVQNRVPSSKANTLIELSGGRIKKEVLVEFVFT